MWISIGNRMLANIEKIESVSVLSDNTRSLHGRHAIEIHFVSGQNRLLEMGSQEEAMILFNKMADALGICR